MRNRSGPELPNGVKELRRKWDAGFCWHLMAALLYTTGLLLTGWAWLGTGVSFGSLELLRDGQTLTDGMRWFAVVTIFGAGSLGCVVLVKEEAIESWAIASFGKWKVRIAIGAVLFAAFCAYSYVSQGELSSLTLAISIISALALTTIQARIGAYVFFLAFVGAVVAAAVIVGKTLTAIALCLIVGAAVGCATVFLLASREAYGNAAMGAIVFGGALSGLLGYFAPEFAFPILLLLVTIPTITAFANWALCYFVRALGRTSWMSRKSGTWRHWFDTCLRIGVAAASALLLVVFLAFSLSQAGQAVVWIFDAHGTNSWKSYLCCIAQNPSRDGFWPSSMLLCALLLAAFQTSKLFAAALASSTGFAKSRRSRLRSGAVALGSAIFLLWALVRTLEPMIAPFPQLLLTAATLDPAFAEACLVKPNWVVR